MMLLMVFGGFWSIVWVLALSWQHGVKARSIGRGGMESDGWMDGVEFMTRAIAKWRSVCSI
jgi:hypothetical protein